MNHEEIEEIGNEHIGTSIDTPLRPGAFDLSDDEKIEKIQNHFAEIMDTLGLDLNDDSLGGTPYRVAKMFVKELFHGLDPKKQPNLSTFENKYGYDKMLVEKNIQVDSTCEHHFLPIYGKAHVAYKAKENVIGLSKINRIVDYYSHRPQVQERLSLQILNALKEALGTDDVIVVIDAKHMCVSSRGIKDKGSSTVTIEYDGCFNDENVRKEFFKMIDC